MDFFLKRVQTFHIRGRVVNAINKASPTGIELDLFASEPFGGLYPSLRVKDSQGQFDMPGVAPGSYFVRARLKDGDELLGGVRRPVTVVNDDVNEVRLVLTPGPTIAGSVEAKGAIALSSLHIILAERYIAHIDWTHNEAATKTDGSLEFDGVPDDHYFLRISGLPQNFYVKSANLGGKDILDSGFEVSGGLPPGPKLKIVLSDDGGRLAGSVILNSKPLGDALVTLLPADFSKRSSDWWCKSTKTDGSGNFAFAAIRPGDYRVFAWEKIIGGEGEAYDPSFLDHFEDQGQEIQVDSGAALTLQLNAIPASKTQAVEALLF